MRKLSFFILYGICGFGFQGGTSAFANSDQDQTYLNRAKRWTTLVKFMDELEVEKKIEASLSFLNSAYADGENRCVVAGYIGHLRNPDDDKTKCIFDKKDKIQIKNNGNVVCNKDVFGDGIEVSAVTDSNWTLRCADKYVSKVLGKPTAMSDLTPEQQIELGKNLSETKMNEFSKKIDALCTVIDVPDGQTGRKRDDADRASCKILREKLKVISLTSNGLSAQSSDPTCAPDLTGKNSENVKVIADALKKDATNWPKVTGKGKLGAQAGVCTPLGRLGVSENNQMAHAYNAMRDEMTNYSYFRASGIKDSNLRFSYQSPGFFYYLSFKTDEEREAARAKTKSAIEEVNKAIGPEVDAKMEAIVLKLEAERTAYSKKMPNATDAQKDALIVRLHEKKPNDRKLTLHFLYVDYIRKYRTGGRKSKMDLMGWIRHNYDPKFNPKVGNDPVPENLVHLLERFSNDRDQICEKSAN